MLTSTLKALTLAAGLLASGTALAATEAVVTTDLNVRTGPSAAYQRYGTIPAGDNVTVYGCLSGYNWCDVDWAGGRGWVSGNYLAYLGQRYYRQPISTVGISIGVPVFGFDPYDYHRRHYVGRSWYRDRYLDRAERREIRREIRRDRREDWREDRRENWREDRREDRRDLRDVRRDFRQDRRDVEEARDDVRDARRDLMRARREDGDVRDARREFREERRDLRDAREDFRDSRRQLIEERRF